MALNLSRNIADPDGFYEYLVESQRMMTEEEANRMNARLVLILMNHLGDGPVFAEALDDCTIWMMSIWSCRWPLCRCRFA